MYYYSQNCSKQTCSSNAYIFVTDKSVNFQLLARANMVFIMLMSLAAFLTQLAILNILRYNHTIAVLATTLKKSAGDTSNALVCI